MKRTIILQLIFLIVFSACRSGSPVVEGEIVTLAEGSYTNVGSEELNAMLKSKDFVFVNVHIPFEGDIPDTDLSIPYDQITTAEYLAQLPDDRAAKIVLYCRSGRMSQIAAEELVSAGYTNIWNLENGMVEWERAGFELEK